MSVDEEMREALATYITEAADLLAEFEGGLLHLEGGIGDDETVNSVFRAAHTLKGSAGLFGLGHIVAFTHVIESILDRVRVHEVAISPELVGILLPCKDHLGRLIAGVGAGRTDATADEEAGGQLLLSLLEPYLAAPAAPVESAAGAAAAAGPEGAPGRFYISLRFGSELLRSGMDPISFIRYLSTLGSVEVVRVFEGLIPDAEEMDPEQSYLAFGITFCTDQGREAVEEVFDFVRDDSDIRVLSATDGAPAFEDLLASYDAASGDVAGWLPPLAGPARQPAQVDPSGADELGRQLVASAAASDAPAPAAGPPERAAAERSPRAAPCASTPPASTA
jgi:two-component system chemotaxis sensor kinase CheA